MSEPKGSITPKRTIYRGVKRGLDLLLSLLGAVIASPFLLIIAAAIKLTSPGPVIFKQKRVGKSGSTQKTHSNLPAAGDRTYFTIYKFRTMRIDVPKDVPTHMLKDPKAAMTPIGGFLRRTSLDELPQLFNIIKGDMAIVGPRPALWNQDDLVAEREKYGANDILPGITGFAQVNGRDELPIPVKAKLDGEYVARMNFGFDVKILFRTVFSVIKAEGVSEGAPGAAEGSDGGRPQA